MSMTKGIIAKISKDFVAHKAKFNDVDKSKDLYVDGEAMCRMAATNMHTDNGVVFLEFVFAPEGGVFMQTQMLNGTRHLDTDGDDPAALAKEMMSYVDDIANLVDKKDFYLTDPVYQDVTTQIAMEKNAEGNFDPILCSVTPLEDTSSVPAP